MSAQLTLIINLPGRDSRLHDLDVFRPGGGILEGVALHYRFEGEPPRDLDPARNTPEELQRAVWRILGPRATVVDWVLK